MIGNLLTWIVPVMCVLGVLGSLILIMNYITVRESLLPFLRAEEHHNVMTGCTKKKHLVLKHSNFSSNYCGSLLQETVVFKITMKTQV